MRVSKGEEGLLESFCSLQSISSSRSCFQKLLFAEEQNEFILDFIRRGGKKSSSLNWVFSARPFLCHYPFLSPPPSLSLPSRLSLSSSDSFTLSSNCQPRILALFCLRKDWWLWTSDEYFQKGSNSLCSYFGFIVLVPGLPWVEEWFPNVSVLGCRPTDLWIFTSTLLFTALFMSLFLFSILLWF